MEFNSFTMTPDVHPSTEAISNFVYYYPDLAVVMLNKHGYPIDMATATLPMINELVFKALYNNQDIDLAKAIDEAIANDGNSNFVMLALAGLSAVTSLVGTFTGKSEAKKQRALLKNLALADLAQQQKIQYENIRTAAETDRIKILTNTLESYRTTLQKESTIRLRDTWIYITAIAVGMGIFYGILLINEKK